MSGRADNTTLIDALATKYGYHQAGEMVAHLCDFMEANHGNPSGIMFEGRNTCFLMIMSEVDEC